MPRAAIIAIAAMLVLAVGADCDEPNAHCARFVTEVQADISRYLRESCLERYGAVIAQLAARPYAHELPQVDEAEKRREFEALYDEDPKLAAAHIRKLRDIADGRYDYVSHEVYSYFEEPIDYMPRAANFDGRPPLRSDYVDPISVLSVEAIEWMAQRKADATERIERLVRQNDNERMADRAPGPYTEYAFAYNEPGASCWCNSCGCGKRVEIVASEPTHVPDSPILYELDEPPTNGRGQGFDPPLDQWPPHDGTGSKYYEENLVFESSPPPYRATVQVQREPEPCDPDSNVFAGIRWFRSGKTFYDQPLDLDDDEDDEEYEFDEPPVQSVQDFMAAAHDNRLTEEENAEIDAALQAVLDEQCGGGPADDDPSPIVCKYPEDVYAEPYECVPDPEGRRMRDFPVIYDFGCDADPYYLQYTAYECELPECDAETESLLRGIQYAAGNFMRGDPASDRPVVLRPRAPCPQHKLDAIRVAFPNATLVEPGTTTPATD
jgi:hypothetical protein